MTQAADTGNHATRYSITALRALCHSQEPLGAADIARIVNVPVGMANRALISLVATRFAERVPHSSKFVAGNMTSQLARALLERYMVRTPSLPFLRQIGFTTGSSVSLWASLGYSSLRIATVRATEQQLRLGGVGERLPPVQGPVGLAILSQFAPEMQKEISDLAGSDQSSELANLERNGFVLEKTDGGVWRAAVPVPTTIGSLKLAVSLDAVRDPKEVEDKAGMITEIVLDLAKTLDAHPDLLRDPFGHIPANEIALASVSQ